MKFVIPDPENPIVGKFSSRLKGGEIVHECRKFGLFYEIIQVAFTESVLDASNDASMR